MKQIVLIILLLFSTNCLLGQQIMWEQVKINQDATDNVFANVLLLEDSTLYLSSVRRIIQGTTTDYSNSFSRYDLSGSLGWHSQGRVLATGEQSSVIESDSIVMFTGSPRVPPNSTRAILQRVNTKTGDTLSARFLPTPNYVNFITSSIIKDSNNGFTIAGFPYIDFQKKVDYSLIKTDSIGNVIWYRNYGGWNNDYLCTVIRNTRGNYVISGNSASYNTQPNMSGFHPFIIEVSPTGDSLNSRVIVVQYPQYSENNYRMYNNMMETTDGGYVLSGRFDSVGTLINFIVKLDAQFNTQWSYLDRNSSAAGMGSGKVQELANGSYALYLSSGNRFAVIKVSATGQYQSHHIYQSSFNCDRLFLYDWKILDDGTAVVCGRCKSNEAYVARISGVGAPAVVGTAKALVKQTATIEVYPNPARNQVQLNYYLPTGTASAEVQLYELATGREMKRVKLNITATQQAISLSGFANGMYAYTLLVNGVPAITKKLVVVK